MQTVSIVYITFKSKAKIRWSYEMVLPRFKPETYSFQSKNHTSRTEPLPTCVRVSNIFLLPKAFFLKTMRHIRKIVQVHCKLFLSSV